MLSGAEQRARADTRMRSFGPVGDPNGAYGTGIISAEGQSESEALRDRDPAIRPPHGFRTEVVRVLRLVTPTGTYDAVPR